MIICKMMIKNYQIKKLTPSIGAEIKGIDFTKSLNKSDYDFIYESLIKNQVIFIIHSKKCLIILTKIGKF